jgi:hypothetical protein
MRLQAAQFDMDRMRVLGNCTRSPFLCDARKAIVLGDLPTDLHRLFAHATAIDRIGCEPRPQHAAVLRRTAGSDAEAEGIGGKVRSGGAGPQGGERQSGSAAQQQRSAAEP